MNMAEFLTPVLIGVSNSAEAHKNVVGIFQNLFTFLGFESKSILTYLKEMEEFVSYARQEMSANMI